MSVAAIAIDNFLSSGQWETIQSSISSHLNSSYEENRNDLHTQINLWIETKLKELGLWQDAWGSEIKMFSSLNSLPKNIDVESSDPENGGYHIEDGGYIYYIHPQWESTWGGNLKFKDCDIDKIEPKPNRFVWVNPNIWHGIEVVDSSANTNRVTVVAWPTGTVEYANANVIINTNI